MDTRRQMLLNDRPVTSVFLISGTSCDPFRYNWKAAAFNQFKKNHAIAVTLPFPASDLPA